MQTSGNTYATVNCAKTNFFFFKNTAHPSDKETRPGQVVNGRLSLIYTHTRAQRVKREKTPKTSWHVESGAKKTRANESRSVDNERDEPRLIVMRHLYENFPGFKSRVQTGLFKI